MLTRRRFLAGTSLAFSPLPALSTTGKSSGREKILFDTDIGSDIDDAVALSYLLREPRCELLGITTVTGEASRRADLARALCDAAGQNTPIFTGAETPLIIPSKQPRAPQADKLTGAGSYASGHAISFLRETVHANPGEITLLAVGPLTNIALLFKSDPLIAGLLKQFVWMGGKYSDYPTPWGPNEWNAIVDPHATRMVLSTPIPAMTAYGLDMTWQISMTPEQVRQRFTGDQLLEIVLDWSEVWFRERELLHFHDPLAAVGIFDQTVCSFKHGRIDVDLEQPDRLGVTTFVPDARSRQRFASTVDTNQFFKAFFAPFS